MLECLFKHLHALQDIILHTCLANCANWVVACVQVHHPGWSYMLWDKSACEQLLRERYPWFLHTWEVLGNGTNSVVLQSGVWHAEAIITQRLHQHCSSAQIVYSMHCSTCNTMRLDYDKAAWHTALILHFIATQPQTSCCQQECCPV